MYGNRKVTHCYKRKGCSYYRPNNCGYTDDIRRAGIYTKEDALNECLSVSDLRAVPIDVKEHNKMILTEVQELLSRII